MQTEAELDVKALFDRPADKLLQIKAETLAYPLGHVNSEALLDTLAHTLAKVEVEKPADTLCDVKALALVDLLAYMLAWKKGKILAATPGEKCSVRHWSRRWLTF